MSAQDPQTIGRHGRDEEQSAGGAFAFRTAHGSLGPYELRWETGEGALGPTYLARRTDAEHDWVTLETLAPAWRPRARELFERVARCAPLDHPGLSTVHDCGDSDGVPYLVRDALLGETLSRVLVAATGAPHGDAVACALRVAAELCATLHATLERRNGLERSAAHGKLALDELVVLYDGSTRVIDYSFARFDHHAPTSASQSAYRSPEQLRMQPFDRRADVWTMGVLLWELTTGQRLFQRASSLRATADVLGLPLDPPSRINLALPTALDAIVMGALERDPSARIASCGELGQALESLIASWCGEVSRAQVADWLRATLPGAESARRRAMDEQPPGYDVDQSGPQLRRRELVEPPAVEQSTIREHQRAPEGSAEPALPAGAVETKSQISAWLEEHTGSRFETQPLQKFTAPAPLRAAMPARTPVPSTPMQSGAAPRSAWLVLAPATLIVLALLGWWLYIDGVPKPAADVTTPLRATTPAELAPVPADEAPPQAGPQGALPER